MMLLSDFSIFLWVRRGLLAHRKREKVGQANLPYLLRDLMYEIF
jgi:hypothetical protein